MKKTLYILLLLSIFSCKNEVETKEAVLVRVGDKYLYKKDLKNLTKDLKGDSSLIYSETIDNWIIKQLEYQEAVKSIGENNLEIENLVDDYKTFLYVDKYKQEYVKKNLDSLVSKEEILEFYEKNKDLYILDKNIVKASYIKTSLKAPKLYKLIKWLKTDNLEGQENLSAYCVQYAEKYDDFDNNWVVFDNIIKNVPKKISNTKSFLKYSNKIEVRDSSSYYLVYIKDYKLVNDTSPVDYIKEKVIKNILKQRKKDLLISLKNNLLREAKAKNIIENSYKK